MTLARQAVGRLGEAMACRALEARHYAIVARRYRTRWGELDIVARDGATLVFIEVKARSGAGFGQPHEAVTPQKQQRIAAMAAEYLAAHRLGDVACRFDVVGIDVDADPPTITVLQDAFRPGW